MKKWINMSEQPQVGSIVMTRSNYNRVGRIVKIHTNQPWPLYCIQINSYRKFKCHVNLWDYEFEVLFQ